MEQGEKAVLARSGSSGGRAVGQGAVGGGTKVGGAAEGAGGRGWREPGNMTLQRGRIFGLVLFKRRITDQGVGPAWQRQSGARAG